ncbi:MAG: PucR family transcriptional regulator ligand-binding domain-containing protein [Candidatus Bipolaricaulota bacterium]
MQLTLRQALELAEPLRNARVVAGAAGLDNVVASVNVMEVPDIVDWVHPGELLVSTLYPLRDDKAAVSRLIPELAKKKLAGLAVTPETYIEELPQSMVRDADRLGFPLIELPPRVSFVDIIQPLTSRILDLQAAELRQSDAILKRFLDLVLVGGHYSDIAQVISEVCHRPVSIVDRFRRVLGHGGKVGDSVASRLIEEDRAGESYVSPAVDLMGGAAGRGDRAGWHVVTEQDGMEISSLISPVEVSGTSLGSIIVWEPLAIEAQGRSLMAIQHGATVVALKMMETRSIGQIEQQFHNEILEGLLSDQAATRSSALQLAESLGRALSPPFAILLVGSDLPSHRLLAARERREQSNVDASLHLAQRYIRSYRDGVSFWRRGPHLIVCYPVHAQDRPHGCGIVAEMLREVCDRIEKENAPYTVSAGISRRVESLDRFPHGYEEAKQSFEIGRALAGEKASTVTLFDELGLLRFAKVSETTIGIRNYCMDMLGPLLEHDARSPASLVRTLRVFLDANQSHVEAARMLGIHYNTLRYRLRGIRALVGDIFAEPQRRLAVEVALHLYPLLESAVRDATGPKAKGRR